MHKIGIISDTHGLLRPEVEEALQGCEFILHGGDINSQKILDRLQEIAPVYAVRGNNDGEWAKYLPETIAIELCGVHFFIVHNKKMLPKDLDDMTDIVIYGHSHKYEEKNMEGRLYLNPGSCGSRRFTQPATLALLKVDENGSFGVEKINIACQMPEKAEIQSIAGKVRPEDMRKVILKVMRDTDQGFAVGKIAAKNRIGRELAEQICRLYLTHPGVSAEGIMEKMGASFYGNLFESRK